MDQFFFSIWWHLPPRILSFYNHLFNQKMASAFKILILSSFLQNKSIFVLDSFINLFYGKNRLNNKENSLIYFTWQSTVVANKTLNPNWKKKTIKILTVVLLTFADKEKEHQNDNPPDSSTKKLNNEKQLTVCSYFKETNTSIFNYFDKYGNLLNIK